MPPLKSRIIDLVNVWPGLTDREITDRLLGASAAQQSVNQVTRTLSESGRLVRRSRPDGKLANYPPSRASASPAKSTPPRTSGGDLSEDDVKRAVEAWLQTSGWRVADVKWGKAQGIDIEAQKGSRRWIIEAKGCGSLDAMRVNYFLSILGELLQRMDDPNARYSIAPPDMKQFRGLWQRLPDLAKTRTTISVLFVDSSGRVAEITNGSTGAGTAGVT